MNLEADQAVQEARFAGACQDQHAGRPAPDLGWPGERKSIVQQAETSVVSRNETNQGYGAWGPGSRRGLGPRAWGRGAGASRALGPGLPPTPRPRREKRETLSVTETIQHAPQGRRTPSTKPQALKTRPESQTLNLRPKTKSLDPKP